MPAGHIGVADKKQPALPVLHHGVGAECYRGNDRLARQTGGKRQVLQQGPPAGVAFGFSL